MKTTPIREDGGLIVSTETIAEALVAFSNCSPGLEEGHFHHLTVERYQDREGHEFRVIALRDDQRRAR